jgi:hypothetical protein
MNGMKGVGIGFGFLERMRSSRFYLGKNFAI